MAPLPIGWECVPTTTTFTALTTLLHRGFGLAEGLSQPDTLRLQSKFPFVRGMVGPLGSARVTWKAIVVT